MEIGSQKDIHDDTPEAPTDPSQSSDNSEIWIHLIFVDITHVHTKSVDITSNFNHGGRDGNDKNWKSECQQAEQGTTSSNRLPKSGIFLHKTEDPRKLGSLVLNFVICVADFRD